MSYISNWKVDICIIWVKSRRKYANNVYILASDIHLW